MLHDRNHSVRSLCNRNNDVACPSNHTIERAEFYEDLAQLGRFCRHTFGTLLKVNG